MVNRIFPIFCKAGGHQFIFFDGDTILDPLPKDKKKKGLGLWKKIEEWF
jgi:hypothetical protein